MQREEFDDGEKQVKTRGRQQQVRIRLEVLVGCFEDCDNQKRIEDHAKDARGHVT
jgi:hypothetical protein